ncbi:unnamed protein product [Orchesella dallaii]|uniref:Uncharacterized protein n=1 Tax=Orchesella dallaii TaxID=48710 RepID=A0ABP1PXQ1_9HEXA
MKIFSIVVLAVCAMILMEAAIEVDAFPNSVVIEIRFKGKRRQALEKERQKQLEQEGRVRRGTSEPGVEVEQGRIPVVSDIQDLGAMAVKPIVDLWEYMTGWG